MTEQEFYIWLLNCDSKWPSEFNSEFLKNYEIAKLVLDKFGINKLNEIQHKNLNFEAVSAWFRVSKYIHLQHDIPEILELLPERIIGNLNLQNSKIQSFPELESVGGYLDLVNSKIQFLPELEAVGDFINLRNSKIKFLPKLEAVGGSIYTGETKLYYINYFNETGRQHLTEKVRW